MNSHLGAESRNADSPFREQRRFMTGTMHERHESSNLLSPDDFMQPVRSVNRLDSVRVASVREDK